MCESKMTVHSHKKALGTHVRRLRRRTHASTRTQQLGLVTPWRTAREWALRVCDSKITGPCPKLEHGCTNNRFSSLVERAPSAACGKKEPMRHDGARREGHGGMGTYGVAALAFAPPREPPLEQLCGNRSVNCRVHPPTHQPPGSQPFPSTHTMARGMRACHSTKVRLVWCRHRQVPSGKEHETRSGSHAVAPAGFRPLALHAGAHSASIRVWWHRPQRLHRFRKVLQRFPTLSQGFLVSLI